MASGSAEERIKLIDRNSTPLSTETVLLKELLKKSDVYFNEPIEKLPKELREQRQRTTDEFKKTITQTYRDLFANSKAADIMKIVSKFSKKVIFLPEDDNLFSKNKCKGLTRASEKKIIIASKNFNCEEFGNKFKGIIIHEFCHFAVQETFRNDRKAYFSWDKKHKNYWENTKEQCREKKDEESLIAGAFFQNYVNDDDKLRELVVRYFQYQIIHKNEQYKKKEFLKKFPLLCEVCEDYVLKHFINESGKMIEVSEIHKEVFQRPLYQVDALEKKIDLKVTDKFQIVKSKNTSLVANFIFHKLYLENKNINTDFVFVDLKYLSENEKNLKKLKHSVRRKVKLVFVINFDCEDKLSKTIEKEFEVQLEKISKIHDSIVLIGENKSFDFLDSYNEIKNNRQDKVINFTWNDLSEVFKESIEINFQGKNMLLTGLVISDFDKITSIPKKIHEQPISIGNQMELKLLPEYVERKFLIQNQSDDKWNKFDDFDNIFSKYKRILVANEPGAGKSIESIKMYYRLKEKYPKDWIIHINLSRLVEVFDKEKGKIHSYSESEEFKALFCRSILKLNEFECDLFEFLMKSGRVILIIDSLDEISPFYLTLVQSLTEMIFLAFSDQRIIIFTRPHLVIDMEQFEFTLVKIDEMEENARNDLISNILKKKCSEKARNDMKKSVHSFLQKRNFHTPLLIRMVTEVASMKKFILDEMTLYDIYKKFCNQLDRVQEEKNEDINAEEMNLRNIEKYFQKCSIEKLIENRLSGIESLNNERIEISKEDLMSFKDDFFSTLKVPDVEKLQRKGITIHSKSNPKEFDFIHASFNDFIIADFIIEIIEIKSLVENYKNFLIEIFSMLYQENRLTNVIEFLKAHEDVKYFLKEFDVISQLIDDKKVKDGININIMPVIKFIADTIARDSITRKICKRNELYSSEIIFTDPTKTLEKLCSLMNRSSVYEIVLMNRSYNVDKYNHNRSGNHPINILDILAECGTEDSFGFYVPKDIFGQYFDKLTVDHFKIGQIACMMEVLTEVYCESDDYLEFQVRSNKFNRSLFLMTRIQNKIVIETFLDFYEKLLEKDSYFSNLRFSCFISIIILNNESDDKKLKNLIKKLADLKKKSVRELFSCSQFKLGNEWGNTIGANIRQFREVVTPEQFEKATNFYIDIFDNGTDCSDQQGQFWFIFVITLVENELFDIFKIALNKLAEKYEKTTAVLRDILMRKSNESMTILQTVFYLNTAATDKITQITDFTFKYYKRIFGYDASEIRDLFTNPTFFIKFFLAQNVNTQIISIILQFLSKTECKTDSWFDLMISYSKCIGNHLIVSLLKTRGLRELLFTGKHPELPNLMKETLQKCINSQNYSEAFYEIISNEFLTKDELADILDALFCKHDMLESQISQILSYKNPKNGFTIIIAASICEQEGRIEILMKLLESYSDTELFKNCLLATGNEGESALYYLLGNEHQEYYFLTLFDKIESYHISDRKETDRMRDLKYLEEIFYATLVFDTFEKYGDSISEVKCKILEKLFKNFSRDEQKELILKEVYGISSLLVDVVKETFKTSKRVLNFTLEALFNDEKSYNKVLKKLKRFSLHGRDLLVSAGMFSLAFKYYKLIGSGEVIDHLQYFFDVSMSSCSYNISVGNFQYFRQNHVISHLISVIENNNISDYNLKNLTMTFIFMLNCDDYLQLLEKVRKKIQNYDRFKNLNFLYSLINSVKLNIEELEVFFIPSHPYGESPFLLHLKNNSYRFLHEFLDVIESMCINKAEFCTFLASQISRLQGRFKDNIFHNIVSEFERDFNSTMYFDIYETLKIKLGNSKLLNDLQKQKNDAGITPLMLALKYTNVEKCLKFFSENLVETSLKEFLYLNDISHLIFINFIMSETIHKDFESIKKPFKKFFENSEIDEMFENACMRKYPRNLNFIHKLFESEFYSLDGRYKFLSNKCLSLLFDEMRKRFSIDRLTELILEEDELNRNPLEIISSDDSFMPYLDVIEKHFDRKTIKTLLVKNEGTHNFILYKVLRNELAEDTMFTVQFYKKYFSKEYENMLKRLLSQLISVFEIVNDYIHDPECIKTIFSQMNKDGQFFLAIDNFEDLSKYVHVVKQAELYFSTVVVKIKDSIYLQELFSDANNYERYELIELLKEYHPDKWSRILVNNQIQTVKTSLGKFYSNPVYKMKIIDLGSEECGYSVFELLCVLVKTLSNSEKRVEQENNGHDYAIVIHDYRHKSKEFALCCLQAVYSIPREKLPNTRINGLRIEWEYDEEKKKSINLNCNNKNQEFSLDMILKSCISIKSDAEQIKVLVPIGNSENSSDETMTEGILDISSDSTSDDISSKDESDENMDDDISDVSSVDTSDNKSDDKESSPPRKRKKKIFETKTCHRN